MTVRQSPSNRSAVELARAAARGARQEPGFEIREPKDALSEAASPAPQAKRRLRMLGVGEQTAAFIREGARAVAHAADVFGGSRPSRLAAYENMLASAGLTAVDALSDPHELLHTALTPSDLKQRALAAQAARLEAEARARRSGQAIASAASLGAAIRGAREAQGLSQEKFAAVAGVGRRFVSELESGKSTLEFDKVVQVARAAGLDLVARERP